MENQNNSPHSVLNKNTQTSDQTIYSPQVVVPGSQFAPQVLEQNEDVVKERTVNNMLESEFMAQKRVQEHNNGSELSIGEDALAPRYRIGKSNKSLVGLASLAVIILLGLGGLALSGTGNKKLQPGLGISDQSVSVLGTETTDSLKELTDKGSDRKLIVNGDIVSTSGIAISSSNSWGQLVIAKLSADQRYLLPDASGTLCLDSNNCNYANEDNVVNSIGGQGGAIKLGSGLTMQGSTLLANSSGVTTSINSLTGSITLLGVNNRTSISSANNFITITTPQDISTSSSPSFQTVSLASAGTQGGNLICDQSNNCGFSTVTNAFVQDGNSFGASAILGTNDGNNLIFETNNISRVTIDTTGNVGISAASNGAKLYVPYQNGDLGGVIHGSGYIFGSGGQALIIAGDMTNSNDNLIAIAGESYSATAITGSSVTGSGIYGESQDNFGVSAVSINNTAIMGLSVASGTSFAGVQGMNWNDGYGVRGDGIGLFGPSNAIGVGAFGTNNYGLYASSSSNTSAYFQASKRTPTCFPFVCPVPPPDVYPTQPTVVIQQFETRTENLLELQLSDNTPVFQIGYNGHTAIGNGSAIDDCSLLSGLLGSVTCYGVLNVQETVSNFSKDYTSGINNQVVLDPGSGATVNSTIQANLTSVITANNNANYNIIRGEVAGVLHLGSGSINFAEATHFTVNNYDSGGISFAKGLQSDVINSSLGNILSASGLDANVVNLSGGTISTAGAIYANSINLGAGSIGTNYGVNVATGNTGSGSVTSNYGINIQSATNSGGGSLTNNYGLFIQDQSGVGSVNSFNIYSEGANAKNYFAGSIGINNTTVPNRLSVNTLTTADSLGQLVVSTDASTNKGLIIQGIASQTANLQEWQDYTGLVRTMISNVGNMYFNHDQLIGAGTSYNSVWNRINLYNGATGDMEITMHNNNWYLRHSANATIAGSLGIGSTSNPGATLQVTSSAAGTKGVIIKGASSQTASLQEWQSSTGTVLASISAAGHLTVVNATVNGTLTVNGNATVNGHIVTGNSSGSTTVAAGAGAGAGASALVSGNDTSGKITITTGTGAGTGVLGTVTFAHNYGSAPNVVLTPANGNGSSIQYFAGSSSTTTFTIDANNAPTDGTTYTYYYHVME